MFESSIVRVFDVYDLAQQARTALLQEGFAADAVALTVRADEAGPVEGNFTVGNTPVESDEHIYRGNYQPAERGHCVLTVDGGNAEGAGRAAQILQRFGARDPDAIGR